MAQDILETWPSPEGFVAGVGTLEHLATWDAGDQGPSYGGEVVLL